MLVCGIDFGELELILNSSVGGRETDRSVCGVHFLAMPISRLGVATVDSIHVYNFRWQTVPASDDDDSLAEEIPSDFQPWSIFVQFHFMSLQFVMLVTDFEKLFLVDMLIPFQSLFHELQSCHLFVSEYVDFR